jgi:hypothetical protein
LRAAACERATPRATRRIEAAERAGGSRRRGRLQWARLSELRTRAPTTGADPEALDLARRPEGDEPCEIGRATDPRRDDAEVFAVEAKARADAAKTFHLVRVVRHYDQGRIDPVASVRPLELEVDRVRFVRPQHLRQRAPPGPQLGVSVLVRLNDMRIQAERGEESYNGLVARLFRGRLQKTVDSAIENGLRRSKAEAERQQLGS